MANSNKKPPCSCRNFTPGKPFTEGQCELCWRYWQDLKLHRHFGGTGCFVGKTIVDPCPSQALSTPPTQNQEGPGTELKKILESLGITGSVGCDCNAKMNQMNAWGVKGCIEHRGEIIEWLRQQRDKRGWGDTLIAGVKSVLQGLWFNPIDPISDLIDLAITRTTHKEN